MSKPLSEQHVFDYRPRFNEADHSLIQAFAKKSGVAPNVIIRHIVKKALQGEPVKSLSDINLMSLQ